MKGKKVIISTATAHPHSIVKAGLPWMTKTFTDHSMVSHLRVYFLTYINHILYNETVVYLRHQTDCILYRNIYQIPHHICYTSPVPIKYILLILVYMYRN